MAKYKLTITDLETGEIERETDFDFFMGSIRLSESALLESEAFTHGENISAIDIAALITALDDIINMIFADYPEAEQVYSIRDAIFQNRVGASLGELEKQAGLL